ncbi:Alpha/Beta hydrolase protein [Schizothecium vesticola]|uniref:Alpha/Beta hydrolase protein n=1 Tax=Schizothecium vesticola TaxID=314040 RepID=A0AA40F1Y2_9PEZI|nr:Alpha/Beta hydrolase protein [Schizothecium vesticola]
MLHHSPASLLLIRTCIILLRYTPAIEVGLLSLILAGRGLFPEHPQRPWLTGLAIGVSVLLLFETAFVALVYRPHKARLARLAEHPPALTCPERLALFERCVANIPNWERYLLVWFLDADLSEIKRDNVRDFLLWAFFDRDASGDETPNDEEQLELLLRRTEFLLGRELPPGRGSANPLRLTIDPIHIRYHSIIWYGIIALLDLITHALLRFHGFTYHAPRTTTIQALTATFPPQPHHPILFLHGIGIGLWPYTRFLSTLTSDPSIGLIALELLPISARLTAPPLPRLEFLRQLRAILAAHGWDDFVVVSHSYGSVLTTHVLGDLGARVRAAVLVDPVSVLLHMPDVAYNFTRRAPRTANEWQLWYFASMDAGVAGALGRHFFWRENIVWREELVGGEEGGKRKVAVCLAGRDLIVDTKSVARYLAGEGDFGALPEEEPFDMGLAQNFMAPTGVEVVWFPGLDHAQVFEGWRERDRVVEVVRRYCLVDGSEDR